MAYIFECCCQKKQKCSTSALAYTCKLRQSLIKVPKNKSILCFNSLVVCPNLPYIPHLVIENAAAYKPGSVITFRCESGFVIKGLKAITCSSTGKLIKHTRKKAAERERERERES